MTDPITAGAASALVRAQTPPAKPALPKCDPALIETIPGYWIGRAKIRVEEATHRSEFSSSEPSRDDVLHHRIAQHYEALAKGLAQ